MLILREKIFGKLDAQEAKKLGITVDDLRSRRKGTISTNTVHDLINARNDLGVVKTNELFVGKSKEAKRFKLNGYEGGRGAVSTALRNNQRDLECVDKLTRPLKRPGSVINAQAGVADGIGSKKVEAVVSDTIKKENKRITQDSITGKARKIVKDAETWIKNNPGKTAAGITIGGATAIGVGVGVKRGIKKLKDKKKKEE